MFSFVNSEPCLFCILFALLENMKTSYLQYLTMVEFMEANGDLSKPSGGPRGRHFIQKKWKVLTNKLNSDGTGDLRTEEKWRKVWSDYKNNCKKKCAKINRAASGTGGGPALQLSLTDIESRVMQIIGVQSAIGMPVEEAGLSLNEATETVQGEIDEPVSEISLEVQDSDWNTPGTSTQPTVAPLQLQPVEASTQFVSSTPADEQWIPSPKKKPKEKLIKLILDEDKKARGYARERERVYDEFERERLRLKEIDMLERIRQKDAQLQLQSQWLEFLKEAMNVFVSYMEKKM